MEGIVRIGTVTDIKGNQARVLYPDSGMTSGWLSVLRHGSEDPWMPNINDVVLCLYIPVWNGDGFIVGVIQ